MPKVDTSLLDISNSGYLLLYQLNINIYCVVLLQMQNVAKYTSKQNQL